MVVAVVDFVDLSSLVVAVVAEVKYVVAAVVYSHHVAEITVHL